VFKEIDSIEVSKDTAAAVVDDGIDGIPIPTESDSTTAVTPAENGKKVTAAKVSTKTSSQPANDAESDEEAEWKGVAPQGVQ